MAFDVFLCHNSSDKEAVKEIGRKLQAAGLAPWLDAWHLEAGQRWRGELERQLGSIQCAAVFVGRDGMGPWQDLEIDVLLSEMVGRGCRVIPVLLPSCPKKPELPLFPKTLNWVDFRDDENEALLRLIRGISAANRGAVPTTPKNGSMPPNNLPFGSLGELFAGRDAALTALEKHLTDGAPALIQAQALTGLGGVGKTRLAVEYAWRHAINYTGIFFVVAESETALRRNFTGLTRPALLDLGLPAEMPEDVVIEKVKIALREHPGWLLIFDNVDTDEAQKALRSILPLSGGRVLITSRLQRWTQGTRKLPMDRLEKKAARDYLLKAAEDRNRRNGDNAAAADLANKLGYLPLALELTAAYLNVNGLAFADLLFGWSQQERQIVEWYEPATTEYPSSLVVTWSRTFAQLPTASQALLTLLAQMAPEPIPLAMLENKKNEIILREAAGSELDLQTSLAGLQRYSLLTWGLQSDKKTIVLHRLVQAAALKRIPQEERTVWVERGVRLVLGHIPEHSPRDIRSWLAWDQLRPHAIRIIEIAEEQGVSEVTEVLERHLGLLLSTKALFEDEDGLRKYDLLALSKAALNNHEFAIKLNSLVLEIQATNPLEDRDPLVIVEECLVKDNPGDVVTVLNNLADSFQEQRRPEESEPVLRRALAIQETSLGNSHPKVAIQLKKLAQLLEATNRHEEAKLLHQRARGIEDDMRKRPSGNPAR